jgi:actin-related protein
MESMEAIIDYVVEYFNVNPQDHEIVIVTTHRLTDKVNVQFLNLLLNNEKFNFKNAMIINQSLLGLYFYNTNVGVVVNLGEKIDIAPICNGTF